MTTTTDGTDLDHDRRVQRAVTDELGWTPAVPATRIGVAVRDGVVTLSGEVDDVPAYLATKRAALRVRGVRAIVDDLWVRRAGAPRSDTDLARTVESALNWASDVPRDSVRATVRKGFVTLTGEVPWEFQRAAAQRAVEAVDGVQRVENAVELTDRPAAADAADRIRSALLRNAFLESEGVRVTVDGTEAVLTGEVRSDFERRQAEQATWASPHITAVRNELRVTE
jgi:osmotically-inducible protein OsmY